jgi:hypothetical protein
MEALVAEALPLGGQFQKPLAQFDPVLSSGLIPITAPLHSDHPAGPPFAHLKGCSKATNGLPSFRGLRIFL